MTCLSCGGETKPWLSTPIDCKKNEPTPYGHVVRCVVCEMGSLHPVPEAGEIASFYDLPRYYTHESSSHIAQGPPSIADRLLTKMAGMADRGTVFNPAEIANSLSGRTVCDLGCGDAAFLQAFVKMGFSCLGVDPDPNARAKAAKGGVTVIDGTADNLPVELDGKTFDLVIMTHALEHSLNPKAAVENAYRLTKPGGLCYIEVPNCDAEHFRRFTICSEMFDAPRHIHFFTLEALKSLVHRVGFSTISPNFIYYQRNFVPAWRGWEAEIAERVLKADPSSHAVKHTLARSIALFLSSFWRVPDRKYDSFGLLLSR